MCKVRRNTYQARIYWLKPMIILIIVIMCSIVPIIVLSTSSSSKAKYFAYTIIFSFMGLLMFLLGILAVIAKIKKSEKLNIKLKCRIFGIVLLVISLLFFKSVYRYYLDFPKVISSDYSYYEGNLENFYFTRQKSGYSTTLVFKEMTFKVDYKVSSQFTAIGKNYFVEYLPNSKMVMQLSTLVSTKVNKQKF